MTERRDREAVASPGVEPADHISGVAEAELHEVARRENRRVAVVADQDQRLVEAPEVGVSPRAIQGDAPLEHGPWDVQGPGYDAVTLAGILGADVDDDGFHGRGGEGRGSLEAGDPLCGNPDQLVKRNNALTPPLGRCTHQMDRTLLAAGSDEYAPLVAPYVRGTARAGGGTRGRGRASGRWLLPAAPLVLASLGLALMAAAGTPSSDRERSAQRAVRPQTSAPGPAAGRSPSASHRRAAPLPSRASIARLVGQMIITRFAGTTPSNNLLVRIQAGQVGGVILFPDNLAGGTPAIRRHTQELQLAAARGGNPPLLVMTDQEGGGVKRLAGPPDFAPADMGSDSTAFSEGAATGRLLREAGINVDLAPVADVERAAGSFLGSRAFGGDPVLVAARACAFARGLASQGVAYTLKHFPGLGSATANTDNGPVSVGISPSALRAGYSAYTACGTGPLAMIMVSSAAYPAVSGPAPAVMSPEIYQRELPLALGGRSALTISDDFQSPAITPQPTPARRAIEAGLDMLLYARSEQTSAIAYGDLVNEARSSLIPVSMLRVAYGRILELKRALTR